MFYDFHIHSVLSPCAEDDMTPNNIVNMSLLKGLECIAVCDHNSVAQQQTMALVAKEKGLHYIYGIEVQTIEEVHVLALFEKEEHCLSFGEWVKEKLPPIPNDVQYFGQQQIMNEKDEEIASEPILLLQSIEAGINETCDRVHAHHGLFILAHVMDRANSIMTQLGFIPQGLPIDGCEIKESMQKELILAMHPYLSEELIWLIDSDAHQLIDIHENEYEIDFEILKKGWRKYV